MIKHLEKTDSCPSNPSTTTNLPLSPALGVRSSIVGNISKIRVGMGRVLEGSLEWIIDNG